VGAGCDASSLLSDCESKRARHHSASSNAASCESKVEALVPRAPTTPSPGQVDDGPNGEPRDSSSPAPELQRAQTRLAPRPPTDGRERGDEQFGAGPVGLFDLPAELLLAVATRLTNDDQLAAALACRTLRDAVLADRRHTRSVERMRTLGFAVAPIRTA
jgi:hypothetical protein